VRARMKLIAGIGALTTVSGAAVAAAAEPVADQIAPAGVDAKLIERPGDRLRDSIRTQQELERLRDAYRHSADEASALGIDVKAPDVDALSAAQLKHETDRLRDQVDKAASSSSVAGVSRATLESIAACESGGDPTAVSSDGTYRGKYQFDRGTWASVGGSGDPAAAPEAEQDYRAALLYSRSSSSPWPVCG
jgi:soluble lytic murein transglycosylase-like protein